MGGNLNDGLLCLSNPITTHVGQHPHALRAVRRRRALHQRPAPLTHLGLPPHGSPNRLHQQEDIKNRLPLSALAGPDVPAAQ